MKRTTICTDCGNTVSKTATKCPNCGGLTASGKIDTIVRGTTNAALVFGLLYVLMQCSAG